MSNEVLSVPMMQTYRTIIITNKDGERFEITGSVAELNVYEDLFSNTLTGAVLYIDEHGGLNDIKFNGNEKLTVELFTNPNDQEVTVHEFYVYSITDLHRINDATSSYTLNFISVESIANKNVRCYSAMTGTNSTVVTELFKVLGSTKTLTTESTSGTYKFVMPSITPLEAINWYSGRSISSESNGSYFLFYETLKNGFKFNCVDTMVEGIPEFTYRYMPAGNTVLAKDVTNIREYDIMQVANSLNGFDEQYNTLWNVDILRKKFVKQSFDFDDDHKSELNSGDKITSSSGKNGFGIDFHELRKVYGTKVINSVESRSSQTDTKDYFYDSIQPKLSAMRQYAGLKLRCLIFGNRALQVGKTLTLEFMKTKMFDKESKSESRDELLSGKYLITAVRYIYKTNEFNMSIEVVKDSKQT